MKITDSHESIGIYRIVSPNNSVYIGMTCDSFKSRVRKHIKDLRRGVHKCKGLQRAHDKYGIDNLSFEILEVMDNYGAYDVAQREIHWWVTHKAWGVNVYNGRPSGNGSVFHLTETKLKISETTAKSLRLVQCHYLRCNKEFRSNFGKFCSVSCRLSSEVRTCIKCQDSFTDEPTEVKTCVNCRILKQSSRRGMSPEEIYKSGLCAYCGKKRNSKRARLYCSRECLRKDRMILEDSEINQKIAEKYLSGLSMEAVGKLFEMSDVSVMKILESLGIPRRKGKKNSS